MTPEEWKLIRLTREEYDQLSPEEQEHADDVRDWFDSKIIGEE
jgi:hypothetical protein